MLTKQCCPTALRCYVRRNRLCLISSVGFQSTNDYCQLLLMLNGEGDKSFVDDLVVSRYCKCESSLCCYEALRYILCFYDLFLLVLKLTQIAKKRCNQKLLRISEAVLHAFFALWWQFGLEVCPLIVNLFTVAILAQGKQSG